MSSRKEKAARTRAAMLGAAFRLFAAHGWQGTTMAAVAREAGVAEQTVYFTFHTKAELFWAMVQAHRNDPAESTEVMATSWIADAFAEPDARRTLAIVVEHSTEILRRLAPVAEAMEAAARADADVAARLATVEGERRQGMTMMMTALSAKAPLVVPVDRAVDVVDVVEGMATYNAFTSRRGWTNEEYKAWAYRTLTQLLPPLGPASARRADAAATRGCSFHDLVVGGPPPPERSPGADRRPG